MTTTSISSEIDVLSRREKAAVIVRLLLSEGADIPLTRMPHQTQLALAEQIGRMGPVKQTTVNAVAEEFLAELAAVGLSFPDGVDGALAILEGRIDASIADQLRRKSTAVSNVDPWEIVLQKPAEDILPLLLSESTEIGAILLAKLTVPKAAEILGMLPGQQARRLAHAMSRTGGVAPKVVQRIGKSLALQLSSQPAKAFDKGPVEQVGAILNFSPAVTREDVLDGLTEADKPFADEVRKAIFTFANIATRVDPRDVPTITREVEQDILVIALCAATGDLAPSAEFILGNMSKRMAEGLREEMEEKGTVKADEGEAAMGALVAAIRTLEEAGTITLIAQEED